MERKKTYLYNPSEFEKIIENTINELDRELIGGRLVLEKLAYPHENDENFMRVCSYIPDKEKLSGEFGWYFRNLSRGIKEKEDLFNVLNDPHRYVEQFHIGDDVLGFHLSGSKNKIFGISICCQLRKSIPEALNFKSRFYKNNEKYIQNTIINITRKALKYALENSEKTGDITILHDREKYD